MTDPHPAHRPSSSDEESEKAKKSMDPSAEAEERVKKMMRADPSHLMHFARTRLRNYRTDRSNRHGVAYWRGEQRSRRIMSPECNVVGPGTLNLKRWFQETLGNDFDIDVFATNEYGVGQGIFVEVAQLDDSGHVSSSVMLHVLPADPNAGSVGARHLSRNRIWCVHSIYRTEDLRRLRSREGRAKRAQSIQPILNSFQDRLLTEALMLELAEQPLFESSSVTPSSPAASPRRAATPRRGPETLGNTVEQMQASVQKALRQAWPSERFIVSSSPLGNGSITVTRTGRTPGFYTISFNHRMPGRPLTVWRLRNEPSGPQREFNSQISSKQLLDFTQEVFRLSEPRAATSSPSASYRKSSYTPLSAPRAPEIMGRIPRSEIEAIPFDYATAYPDLPTADIELAVRQHSMLLRRSTERTTLLQEFRLNPDYATKLWQSRIMSPTRSDGPWESYSPGQQQQYLSNLIRMREALRIAQARTPGGRKKTAFEASAKLGGTVTDIVEALDETTKKIQAAPDAASIPTLVGRVQDLNRQIERLRKSGVSQEMMKRLAELRVTAENNLNNLYAQERIDVITKSLGEYLDGCGVIFTNTEAVGEDTEVQHWQTTLNLSHNGVTLLIGLTNLHDASRVEITNVSLDSTEFPEHVGQRTNVAYLAHLAIEHLDADRAATLDRNQESTLQVADATFTLNNYFRQRYMLSSDDESVQLAYDATDDDVVFRMGDRTLTLADAGFDIDEIIASGTPGNVDTTNAPRLDAWLREQFELVAAAPSEEQEKLHKEINHDYMALVFAMNGLTVDMIRKFVDFARPISPTLHPSQRQDVQSSITAAKGMLEEAAKFVRARVQHFPREIELQSIQSTESIPVQQVTLQETASGDVLPAVRMNNATLGENVGDELYDESLSFFLRRTEEGFSIHPILGAPGGMHVMHIGGVKFTFRIDAPEFDEALGKQRLQLEKDVQEVGSTTDLQSLNERITKFQGEAEGVDEMLLGTLRWREILYQELVTRWTRDIATGLNDGDFEGGGWTVRVGISHRGSIGENRLRTGRPGANLWESYYPVLHVDCPSGHHIRFGMTGTDVEHLGLIALSSYRYSREEIRDASDGDVMGFAPGLVELNPKIIIDELKRCVREQNDKRVKEEQEKKAREVAREKVRAINAMLEAYNKEPDRMVDMEFRQTQVNPFQGTLTVTMPNRSNRIRVRRAISINLESRWEVAVTETRTGALTTFSAERVGQEADVRELIAHLQSLRSRPRFTVPLDTNAVQTAEKHLHSSAEWVNKRANDTFQVSVSVRPERSDLTISTLPHNRETINTISQRWFEAGDIRITERGGRAIITAPLDNRDYETHFAALYGNLLLAVSTNKITLEPSPEQKRQMERLQRIIREYQSLDVNNLKEVRDYQAMVQKSFSTLNRYQRNQAREYVVLADRMVRRAEITQKEREAKMKGRPRVDANETQRERYEYIAKWFNGMRALHTPIDASQFDRFRKTATNSLNILHPTHRREVERMLKELTEWTTLPPPTTTPGPELRAVRTAIEAYNKGADALAELHFRQTQPRPLQGRLDIVLPDENRVRNNYILVKSALRTIADDSRIREIESGYDTLRFTIEGVDQTNVQNAIKALQANARIPRRGALLMDDEIQAAQKYFQPHVENFNKQWGHIMRLHVEAKSPRSELSITTSMHNRVLLNILDEWCRGGIVNRDPIANSVTLEVFIDNTIYQQHFEAILRDFESAMRTGSATERPSWAGPIRTIDRVGNTFEELPVGTSLEIEQGVTLRVLDSSGNISLTLSPTIWNTDRVGRYTGLPTSGNIENISHSVHTATIGSPVRVRRGLSFLGTTQLEIASGNDVVGHIAYSETSIQLNSPTDDGSENVNYMWEAREP